MLWQQLDMWSNARTAVFDYSILYSRIKQTWK